MKQWEAGLASEGFGSTSVIRKRALVTGALAAGLAVAGAGAADPRVDWYTIGAGGTSAGGGFELSATIGQLGAGELSGGEFTLVGGFWAAAAAPQVCAEDLDGDGVIGIADLSRLLMSFGLCIEDDGFDPAADLDSDGCVSPTDLSQSLTWFGTTCP